MKLLRGVTIAAVVFATGFAANQAVERSAHATPPVPVPAPPAPIPIPYPSHAGHYLEIDGVAGGWLSHAASSDAKSLTLACGTGMSRGFYDALRNAFTRPSSLTGAVVEADAGRAEQTRLQFHKGLISEIGFPALDAASKDAAKMTIKLAPEYTRVIAKTGDVALARTYPPIAAHRSAQKKWLPANFSLVIGGTDVTRGARVEPFAVRFVSSANSPYKVEVSNLVVSVPESDAKAFQAWFAAFVQAGPGAQAARREGTLKYLSPEGDVLFTLDLHGLGIFKFAPEKVEAGNENIRRVKAEMYCEKIEFKYGSGATWATNDEPASDPFFHPKTEPRASNALAILP